VEKIKTLLQKVRIDPERLGIFNLSAAEGPKWADICTEFTQQIRALGPSPIYTALRETRKKGGGSNDRG